MPNCEIVIFPLVSWVIPLHSQKQIFHESNYNICKYKTFGSIDMFSLHIEPPVIVWETVIPRHPISVTLHPPGQFFMGAKLFIGTPGMRNKGVLKKFWYWLCENAWLPWQPIADLSMGICLQKYSYLSCHLS